MIDIKDIFIDEFSLPPPKVTKVIIEQLTNIVEKLNEIDQDSNVKLLEWSKRNFQHKVDEMISSAIALSQVELATKIDSMKKVLENIISLYTKLCNLILFTQEIMSHILSLESYI